MKIQHRPSRTLAVLVVLAWLQGSICQASSPYHLLKEVAVGGEGGGHGLAIDESTHRLYVAHENRIEIIDTENGLAVGAITNTPGVYDVALAPQFHCGFASNTREDKMTIFNLRNLRSSKAKTGKGPETVLVSGPDLYLVNAAAPSVSSYEADDADFVGTTPLPGRPKGAAADQKLHRLYCAIQDKAEVAVIDPSKRRVVGEWPVAPGVSPSGMAIDPEQRVLFVSCANNLLVTMNSTNGSVLGTISVGTDAGMVVFEPSTRLVFVSSGEGTLTIAHEDSPDKLTAVQTVQTGLGARTMALDTKTHRVYVPVASTGSLTSTASSTNAASGSLKILVFSPEPMQTH
jgi:DNA-binding beta-propeller fold protein YncE